MKKAELLKNNVPKPTKKNIRGNLFFVDGQPIIELDWQKDMSPTYEHEEWTLIRHFVWDKGWASFYDGKWTTERIMNWFSYSGGKIAPHGKEEAKDAKAAVKEFFEQVGYTGGYGKEIADFEYMIYCKKTTNARKRKEERLTRYAKENTPPLPKDFKKWALKQKANYLYLLQHTKNNQTIDRRFKVDHERNTITEFVRGWSYTPGQNWDAFVYGQHYGCYGKNQTFYDKKPYPGGPVSKKGALYPKGLDDINMMFTAKEALKTEAKCGDEINFGEMYGKYQRDDRAERIVKSGYKELIRLWRSGKVFLYQTNYRDGVEKMLLVSKERYRLLRKWNAGLGIIQAARRGEIEHPRFSNRELAELKKVSGEERKIELANTADDHNLKLTHLIKLLGEETPCAIRTYDDYLHMARHRGANIHDEIVYRNKRWREFHDRWNAEEIKEQETDRKRWANRKFNKIKANAKENEKHFGWRYKGYVMIPAKKASEIIDEGRIQHHCVGSSDTYMERMHYGESFILFLRKEENESVPYYTIEAKYDGTVLQAYSAYDRKPDEEEVNAVLKKWKKEIQKRTERKEKVNA